MSLFLLKFCECNIYCYFLIVSLVSLSTFQSILLPLSRSLSHSLNSIQRALLAWQTHVYIAKASEIDNKQKWNKQNEQ